MRLSSQAISFPDSSRHSRNLPDTFWGLRLGVYLYILFLFSFPESLFDLWGRTDHRGPNCGKVCGSFLAASQHITRREENMSHK